MGSTPSETIVAALVFYSAWVVLVAAIIVASHWSAQARCWRGRLLSQWRAALAIAALFLMAWVVRGTVNPLAPAVFCQALVGLAIARSIPSYEPLPVLRAIAAHDRPWQRIAKMLVLALLFYPANMLGGIGMRLGALLGETSYTRTVASALPADPIQSFFMLLAGAGIAEETTFRLVGVSLVWRLTGRWWLGVVAGALLFGAYHLSPLDGYYRIFWQFPLSQFTASTLIGLVWGCGYVRWGYETVVLGHTLGDWFVVLLMNR